MQQYKCLPTIKQPPPDKVEREKRSDNPSWMKRYLCEMSQVVNIKSGRSRLVRCHQWLCQKLYENVYTQTHMLSLWLVAWLSPGRAAAGLCSAFYFTALFK
jgi:hypothetical protein